MKKVEKELINTNVKLLEEIENREKLIDDLDSFAHTVAHDLRNSIGAIINSSSILKENIQDNNLELLAEMADLIKESATKTMHVMNEILILGTVSHQQVEKKPFDMFKVFNEAVKQLRSVIEEKNAEIHVPEKWPIVLGNSTWIEEVWINYLSNALKYGGNPPIVKVGYESVPGNMIKFWINDNGEGLSEEDQEKLYKKSTRLDPHRAEGYGFGLSIIKRIITKLGGEVGVTCNPKEKNGATFFFTLPLATRHKK
jgi:signal transduction histidine kinase